MLALLRRGSRSSLFNLLTRLARLRSALRRSAVHRKKIDPRTPRIVGQLLNLLWPQVRLGPAPKHP